MSILAGKIQPATVVSHHRSNLRLFSNTLNHFAAFVTTEGLKTKNNKDERIISVRNPFVNFSTEINKTRQANLYMNSE